MNLLCYFLGHKPPVYARKGWYSPGEEYSKLVHFDKDGTERIHAEVLAKCARCEKTFRVARVHVPLNSLRKLGFLIEEDK